MQNNDDSNLGSVGGGGSFGSELGDSNLEDIGDENSDVINGNPEETPLGNENIPEDITQNESIRIKNNLILEENNLINSHPSDEYNKIVKKLIKETPKGNIFERCELFDKNLLINEEMNEVVSNLEKFTK